MYRMISKANSRRFQRQMFESPSVYRRSTTVRLQTRVEGEYKNVICILSVQSLGKEKSAAVGKRRFWSRILKVSNRPVHKRPSCLLALVFCGIFCLFGM